MLGIEFEKTFKELQSVLENTLPITLIEGKAIQFERILSELVSRHVQL